MEPQGYPKCQRDTTRPCKVPQRRKKHIQTARGRVLAEGDVDPAAGSRDEPTRLHVETPVAKRKQRIEVQVARALFLYSINWVPPLPPTPSDFLPLPKPSESFFVPAHVEAQRVKTRGPNPNPTTQAQSKRCLPLFTKAQNLIKILPAGLPNPMLFWYLFRTFSLLVPTRHQHGPQGYPNGAQGCRNEAPRSPQSAQKPPNYKMEAQGATMEPKGHPKC
jgi:hypothetical protein